MLLQENGSEAGSPPRERDSVYDAETEPSAGNSSALIDDADEATQRRPAAGAGGLCASLQPFSVPYMLRFPACATFTINLVSHGSLYASQLLSAFQGDGMLCF